VEVNGHSHVLATLLGKGPLVPIKHGASWTPEAVWTLWSREKFLVSLGNRFLSRLARSKVTIMAMLSKCGKSLSCNEITPTRTAPENVTVVQLVKISLHLLEPEESFSPSLQPTAYPHPESDKS